MAAAGLTVLTLQAQQYPPAPTFLAPDVVRLGDGRYCMYHCAGKGDSPRSALGVAVSDSIAGLACPNAGIVLKSGRGTSPAWVARIYAATLHPDANPRASPSLVFYRPMLS